MVSLNLKDFEIDFGDNMEIEFGGWIRDYWWSNIETQ